jgi:DNA invertase Pin-like site-specific DNA recombinase
MSAIGYIRLSIKDQSQYSLEYQEKSIRDYCARNPFEVANYNSAGNALLNIASKG